MKNILLTGAGGFIGSHLAKLLVSKGLNVVAFVRYNSKNDWGWLEHSNVKNEIKVITGDIRDKDSVTDAMTGVDTVFHLAALIGIPYSYVSPLAYIKTNVEGTYNILQSAREKGVENVLVTSTSETYGTAQYIPIDENHPLVGQSPYAASKIAADQFALSYFRSFNLPVKVVRPFNTFGPRQSARAFIPTVISQVINGNNEVKLGNLSPTRDLTYVKDTVSGFFEIAKSDLAIGKVTNIGMKEEISMENLIKLIGKVMNTKIDVISDKKRVRPEKSEVERLLCDNSKIIENTNWRPKYNLEQGIKETADWMKDNIHFYKSNIYNV